MTELIGLDFETYSGVDLLKHGLHRYINTPTFRPLIAATAEMSRDDVLNEETYDFVADYDHAKAMLIDALDGRTIVAHNAGFEQAVLTAMGIDIPSSQFIDSAVLARAAGAAGKLEAAAPQLLEMDKLAMGYDLIKLFSIPGEYQDKTLQFNPQIVENNPDKWFDFKYYCTVDAWLGLRLAMNFPVSKEELMYSAVTMDMNNTGWHVDLDLVHNMHLRYQTNVETAIQQFRDACDEPDLNLNSRIQLTAWCAVRGVKATSFDEKHVASLLRSVERKLDAGVADDHKRQCFEEVRHLLRTKQIMGGSSLKKLQTIIDTIGTDGRLHDQYLHIGAGATYRTTGRGVQMQNLKRLGGKGDDMAELWAEDTDWDNNKLASNLRQVFCATHEQGQLIVGDFSSVESRGLAWQAGEQWKIDAYLAGQDLYKVQAGMIFGKPADQITKDERQIGKVGELACGYGAGSDAVREFAKNMGVELSEGESMKLVFDWRTANPRIVQYWHMLDNALHSAVETHEVCTVSLPHGLVDIVPLPAPKSLLKQAPDVISLRICLVLKGGFRVLHRVIHGCHIVGRQIQYYKPSERKTGDLWSNEFMNPKTKRLQKYTVYGGKLAGLLTQSLCREVFMDVMLQVHLWCQDKENVRLIGQMHDEIVVDWVPGPVSFDDTVTMMQECMSSTFLPRFPLAAEVKHGYRYIK